MIPALEFIHLASIGSLAQCLEEARSIKPWLREAYDSKEILGWEVITIDTEEKAINRIYFGDYKAIAKSTFPFLYVAIQEGNPPIDHVGYMKNRQYEQIIGVREDRQF